MQVSQWQQVYVLYMRPLRQVVDTGVEWPQGSILSDIRHPANRHHHPGRMRSARAGTALYKTQRKDSAATADECQTIAIPLELAAERTLARNQLVA